MKYSELTRPEIDHILTDGNLTEEERDAFETLASGHTIEQTAEILNYSVATIKRLKNKINAKMSRL